MTAINLPSQKSSAQNDTNVRAMSVRRDARQVISLLELVFNQHLRGAGHHTIAANFSFQDLLKGQDQIVPGFVYSLDKRIVGNVSILESKTPGRYLVANVAVHPDFRRRGIARKMMKQVMLYIKGRAGHQIVLQVEAENANAIVLYQKLGFHAVGTLNDWRMNWYSLKTIITPPSINHKNPDDYGEFLLRPLRAEDTQTVRNLDTSLFQGNLNWPNAPDKRYYERGIQSFLYRFFSGINHEIWVCEARNHQIVGIGIIENEVGRPYMLKIRVIPKWASHVERPLVAKLARRLRYMRSKSISVQQDAAHKTIEHLLKESGFSLKRTLVVMQFDLSNPKRHN
ncbi:MAG: ribosomal protein S18 acetylase RimI-like enzyme [Candidatus Promineifilaceae bacterium]|jgi:ribosomal protein S18 acetylase RimI-like enzyme